MVKTSNRKLQIEVKSYSFSNSVHVCEFSSLLRWLFLLWGFVSWSPSDSSAGANSHWMKCLSVSWNKINVKIWLIKSLVIWRFSRKGVILCFQNTYQYIFDTAELGSILPQSIYSIIVWPLLTTVLGSPKQRAMEDTPHHISAGYDNPPKWYFHVLPRLCMCFLVFLN